MLTDKELLASEKQAITGTAVSTDAILMTGLAGIDRTHRLRAFAQVESGLSGGAATGITVEMIQANNAALTSGVDVLGTSGAVTSAPAGARLIDAPLPAVTKPYFGFRYTVAGGSYGAGTITAGLVSGTETPTQSRPVANSHGF